MEEKKEVEVNTLVVEQLPQVPQKEVADNDGKIYNLLTRDEALTEILLGIRELRRKLK
jgi:hypothetical protein